MASGPLDPLSSLLQRTPPVSTVAITDFHFYDQSSSAWNLKFLGFSFCHCSVIAHSTWLSSFIPPSSGATLFGNSILIFLILVTSFLQLQSLVVTLYSLLLPSSPFSSSSKSCLHDGTARAQISQDLSGRKREIGFTISEAAQSSKSPESIPHSHHGFGRLRRTPQNLSATPILVLSHNHHLLESLLWRKESIWWRSTIKGPGKRLEEGRIKMFLSQELLGEGDRGCYAWKISRSCFGENEDINPTGEHV